MEIETDYKIPSLINSAVQTIIKFFICFLIETTANYSK